MECPRCHETVLDTDTFCGKCGYRFDAEHHDEFDHSEPQPVEKSSYDYDTADETDEAALKRERREERSEKVDALKKQSQARWNQVVTSDFTKDLKTSLVSGVRKPASTKDGAWYAAIPVSLTILGAFLLLYSLILFIPIYNMDGFGLSRLGNTSGMSTFLYILLGHVLLITLGFLYVFIINQFLSDKKTSVTKMLSDYVVLLIPVFIVLLFAWLMMVVGLSIIGVVIYLLSMLLLLVIPLFMLFDGPHTRLKMDAYQFIILYVIIAGTLLFIPLLLVLDQLSVFMLSGIM